MAFSFSFCRKRAASALTSCTFAALVVGALVGCTQENVEPDVTSPKAPPVEKCQGIKLDLDQVANKPTRTLGSSGMQVEIISASPAEPDRGDNILTFLLTDDDDTPHSFVGDVMLSPFMPDHGHGSLPLDFDYNAQSQPEVGKYVFGPIDLFMLGRWDLHFRLLDDDGSEQDATFTFCVEG